MDESRKAFEQWWEVWFGEAPLTPWDELWCGDGYSAEDIDHMWDAWKGSRAAIEIDLPMPKYTCFSQGFYKGIAEQRKNDTDAIRAAGIKVKE
ncbi:MAG: hypothetical protein ACLTYF_22565 [Escherichia sp.]|uniref:hypothetical protein n=1 Tax=Enterobacter hormaechei TaxID=158836 RepID=UPI002051FEAA|nr:MAG TPA: hypothetical protein [Caudoviricetes sp.]DAY78896.1 MAG TPA: hypothetical protein [Caudoviricetes sp.]